MIACARVQSYRPTKANYCGEEDPDARPCPIPISQIKADTAGRLLPQEYECQIRSELHSTLNQKGLKHALTNKAERERTDVWWVEPDLSNTEEVAADIRDVFLSDGIPWFDHYSDLNAAYERVKAERDCLDKYLKAVHFAKRLGHSQEYGHFRRLAKQEWSLIRSSMPWVGERTDLN
jgi:hypothetical protein